MNRNYVPESARVPVRPGPAAGSPSSRPLRHLWAFAAIAVIGGGALFGISTYVDQGAPFILAGVYLSLAFPALVLAHREGGRRAVRLAAR